jgi:GGDEF domain-containing protein
LQRGIEDMTFEVTPGKRVPLGMSIGAAVFPVDGGSYEALLATADSRMYQDKAARKRRLTPTSRTMALPAVRAAHTDDGLARVTAGIR